MLRGWATWSSAGRYRPTSTFCVTCTGGRRCGTRVIVTSCSRTRTPSCSTVRDCTNSARGVATVDGMVVGFATTIPPESGVAADVLELEDLFVDPDWMRRGIGLALVADAVATGRARGAARIEVTANPHALAFYGQAGFVPSGSIETRFGPAARHAPRDHPLTRAISAACAGRPASASGGGRGGRRECGGRGR